MRGSGSGGTPSPLLTVGPRSHDEIQAYPFFLPDGRHFLYSQGKATPCSLRSMSGRSTLWKGARCSYRMGMLVSMHKGISCSFLEPASWRNRLT